MVWKKGAGDREQSFGSSGCPSLVVKRSVNRLKKDAEYSPNTKDPWLAFLSVGDNGVVQLLHIWIGGDELGELLPFVGRSDGARSVGSDVHVCRRGW